MILQETDKTNWCRDVEGADGLTVVFFYAPWCRNCKAVRPKLQRIQKKYPDVRFFQANFKKEQALCYEQRVFNFPTVHFYLPGIGRVGRSVLTASNTDAKMSTSLERFLDGLDVARVHAHVHLDRDHLAIHKVEARVGPLAAEVVLCRRAIPAGHCQVDGGPVR